MNEMINLKVRDDNRSLQQLTEIKIKTLIKNRTFRPGEKLLAEPELSKMLGVSRTTLREVILSLEIQGLITRGQGIGTFVSVIDDNLLDELLEIRMMIEKHAAECIIISGISKSEIEQLRSVIDSFYHATTEELMIERQPDFHRYLVGLTRNKRLIKFYEDLIDSFEVMRFFTYDVCRRKEEIYEQHKSMLNAIINKDFETFKSVLIKHISDVRQEQHKEDRLS